MQPVITPEEMAAIDDAARNSLQELIDRAARAVMSEVLRMFGGPRKCLGKQVLVIAGKGNNGADGRRTAELLEERKIAVKVVAAGKVKSADLDEADLIVDAAYGTGLKRAYTAPENSNTPVLAVDISSGIDGNTGEIAGTALMAERTVTFVALKPGHLLFPGSTYSGDITVADIGLDANSANTWLLDANSIVLPERPTDAHKWNSACWVIGGSAGMGGSVSLAALGAYRVGSGYVRVSSGGNNTTTSQVEPIEAVGYDLPDADWAEEVLKESARFKSLVIGPGMGQSPDKQFQLEKILKHVDVPVVVDGDGLNLLAAAGSQLTTKAPVVLTPHDKEFARLNGKAPEADRLKSVRELAAKLNAIVLLKGPTTLVACPKTGKVLVSTKGDARLATAGTGDVLAGVIGGLLAQLFEKGVEPLLAVAMGAYICGAAAELGNPYGFMAQDLANLIPLALQDINARYKQDITQE